MKLQPFDLACDSDSKEGLAADLPLRRRRQPLMGADAEEMVAAFSSAMQTLHRALQGRRCICVSLVLPSLARLTGDVGQLLAANSAVICAAAAADCAAAPVGEPLPAVALAVATVHALVTLEL